MGAAPPPHCVLCGPWMVTEKMGKGGASLGVGALMRPSMEDPKGLVSLRNRGARKSGNLSRGVSGEHPSFCHTSTS